MSTETAEKEVTTPTSSAPAAKPKVSKKPKAKKAKKAKASKKVSKTPKKKEPGVIDTIKRMCSRGNGASKVEILEELKKAFPKRAVKGMARTVQIQVSRIPKENKGLTMEKTKSETRGKVYTLKSK